MPAPNSCKLSSKYFYSSLNKTCRITLREIATGLDLISKQEMAMLNIFEKALESLESLHATTDAVEVHFRGLIVQLDQAAQLLETDEVLEKIESESSVELFKKV